MCRRLHSFLCLAGWLAFLLAQAGCAVKYSPQVSGKDAAYVVAQAPVWLVSIDGKKTPYIPLAREKRYAVSPGEHRLSVAFSDSEFRAVDPGQYPEYRNPRGFDRRTGQVYSGNPVQNDVDRTAVVRIRSTENVELPFIAEPGHTYYVKSGRISSLWRPHISESRDPVFMDPPP